MVKKLKQLMVLGLAVGVTVTGCSPSGSPTSKEQTDTKQEADNKKGDPVVIRIGSHAGNSMNPDYKDPVTGNYAMNDEDREIALEAMQRVEDKLNVKIEWVQVPRRNNRSITSKRNGWRSCSRRC